ncbi:glycosyltransferase, partial [Photobacterium sp. OFAV2-7]|uniref:glycosyltransferase n=1 Tax=Photobacterium sp. OFAV2-7 TaxID=2917748 RepID=UPI001EF6BEC6
MEIRNLDVETIESNILHGEYEKKINTLKLDFLKFQQSIKENNQDSDEQQKHFHLQLEAMREWISRSSEKLDISRCSSLFAVPTQQLGDDEKLIHRVWMGGSLPEPTKSAMLQWDAAIQAVNDSAYKSILWVWDEDQLRNDPHYVSTGGTGEFTLGQYRFGKHVSHVNSLKMLALAKAKDYFSAVNLLHDKGYYATLSDYFRFMIVIEFGGMYMDSDTIPYKPAALFLAKPEVPDYSHYVQNDAGEWQGHHLDWMNLFLDETGLIVARKNNQSLRSILDKLHEQYMRLPQDMP